MCQHCRRGSGERALTGGPLLLTALGNILCRDDGAGPAALAILLRDHKPAAGVDTLDAAPLGASVLPQLEAAGAVVILAAVRTDGAPGSLLRLEREAALRAVARRLSIHQDACADLLDLNRLRESLPRDLVLLGVVPETTELGVGLTPRVAQSLPTLVERAMGECASLGFPFLPRPAAEPAPASLIACELLETLRPAR